MKKTLIAMAAVAVAGVVSAQVTLTGKLSYGYSTSHSNKEASGTGTNAKAKDVAGFGVHDGHFTMSGSEDLGGGLSAAASMEVLSRGRDTAISGRNASLTVSGGFGSVMMGAIEAGNGIMPLGQAGAPGVGLDGKVLSAAANVDIVKYTLPTLMEGLTLAASITDTPGNTKGRSAGYSQGYAAAFATGGLSASYDYTAYKNQAAAAAAVSGYYIPKLASAATLPTTVAYAATEALPTGAIVMQAAVGAVTQVDTRNRISLSYDFGPAKVGYGRQQVNYTGTTADNVQTTMGVSVPMGAITLGMATAKAQSDGSSTKTTGTDFGIKYALSKRTAVDFGRATWSSNADSEKNKYQRIRLTHTF